MAVKPRALQMAIDEVADLVERVAALRGEIQVVVGQLLPVEAGLRIGGQPLHHIGPGLADEIERRHAAVLVERDFELVADRARAAAFPAA